MRKNFRVEKNLPVLIVLIVLFSFLFGFSLPLLAKDKTVVIVSTFKDRKTRKIKLGEKARDEITNILVGLKYFQVVERSRMETIMNEMNFSKTAYVDEASATKFGKKLGAKLVVFGNVSGVGYNTETTKYKDDKGNTHIKKKASGSATLNVQIVDVESNQTVFSKSLSGVATDEVEPGSNPKPRTTLIPEAIRIAANRLWVPIQKAFPLSGIIIKKEKKGHKYLIYVDFGTNWGIKSGRRLYFYKQGEKIIHPVTGKILSSGKGELLVKDSAYKVFDEYCTAKVKKKEFKKLKIGMIVEARPETWSHGFGRIFFK